MIALYIIAVSITYIVVSILLSVYILKLTKNKIVSGILFILIITFPFWDLIAQKTIKTYYQTYGLLEPKIYAYPKFDKDGKIESLSQVGIKYTPNDLLSEDNIYNSKNRLVHNQMKEVIKYFYETSVYNSKHSNDKTIIRININNNKYYKVKQIKSRYKFVIKSYNKLFSLYKIYEYRIIDTHSNTILGKYSRMIFLNTFSYFREIFLLLGIGNDNGVFYMSNINKINYYEILMRKLQLIKKDNK